MKNLVSIIIPCFNYGRFLQEALDSIDKQTYKNYEIIIVDDGSNDPFTILLLDQLTKTKKYKIYRIINGGPSKARNYGIDKASGDIILPLDADDKIHPNYITEAIDFMINNPEYGIVYCKAKYFGSMSGEWKLPEYNFPNILLGNCIFVTSFFYKSDWKKVGGFDESFLDEWEDYDFWLKIISIGRKVFQIPKFYFYYRKGHDSRAKKTNQDLLDLYSRIYLNHKSFYNENAFFFFKKYLESVEKSKNSIIGRLFLLINKLKSKLK